MLLDYGVEQPVRVVPTGLRLEKFTKPVSKQAVDELKASLGIPQKCRVLMTLGRAAKEKNIEELIRYFSRLDMDNTALVIVGGGPYLETLKALAENEGSSGRIIFTGAVEPDRVPLYYKMGDIFLSASQSETQGLTYIEALASGLPAVCRKDSCLDGVITDGENGGQYTDFDSFASWIKYVLRSEETYKRMSEKAAATADRYSAEGFAKAMSAVYTEVLEKRDNNETENTLYNCENCG